MKGVNFNAIVFIGALVLLITSLVLILGVGEGATITVDDDGGADYTNIQNAIDNATDGDTIEVRDGTYFGNIVVDKPLTLSGTNTERTIISGDGKDSTLKLLANHTLLHGFTVMSDVDSLAYGVYAEGHHNTIRDVNCSSNGTSGIQMAYSEESIIENTIVSKFPERGITVTSSDRIQIRNNILSDLIYGIFFFNTTNSSVIGNEITNASLGLYLHYHSNGNVARENIITKSSYTAFQIQSESSDNLVEMNDLRDSDIGLVISSVCTNNLIINNDISSNNLGIRIQSYGNYSGNNIENNSICFNNEGIHVSHTSGVVNLLVRNNNILNNVHHGVNMSSSEGTSINATNNYWGDPSGPYHAQNNSEGKGDNVTDFVLFDPWLTSPVNPPIAFVDSIFPSPALDSESVVLSGHGESSGDITTFSWSSSIDGDLSSGPDPTISLSPLSLGTHTISLRVQDSAWIWSDPVTTSLIVHQRPVALIESIDPNPAMAGDTITFTGSGTDDGSIASFVWTSSLDGELYNGSSFTYTGTSLSPGTHTITLTVQDDLGAWSEPVTQDIEVLIIPENDIPVVTITSHANWTNVSGTIDLSGTTFDSIGGIQYVEVSHNNGPWQRAVGTEAWTYFIDTSALENGHHFFQVRAFDGTDQSETVTVVLAIDRKGDDGGGGGLIPGFGLMHAIASIGTVAFLSQSRRGGGKACFHSRQQSCQGREQRDSNSAS